MEAITKFEFHITHLDNRVLKVYSDQIIKPGSLMILISISFYSLLTNVITGERKVIVGEGMPQYSNPFLKGNLFIDFEIVFPTSPLDDRQQELVRSALSSPHIFEEIPSHNVHSNAYEEVLLENLSPSTLNNHSNTAKEDNVYDDQKDTNEEAEPELNCVHQ